jgi:hypothetical protein
MVQKLVEGGSQDCMYTETLPNVRDVAYPDFYILTFFVSECASPAGVNNSSLQGTSLGPPGG